MDNIHPLFRSDIPSSEELSSNDIYSALIEISADNTEHISEKDEINNSEINNVIKQNKISSNSKFINKINYLDRKIKGRYQQHLNKINITKSKIEMEKNKKKNFENMNIKIEYENEIEDNKKKRDLAEMEICFSIWSNKQLFGDQ